MQETALGDWTGSMETQQHGVLGLFGASDQEDADADYSYMQFVRGGGLIYVSCHAEPHCPPGRRAAC